MNNRLRSGWPCSNPLAGTDTTLLALSGAGYADSKCFGFASCERRAGAAEGVNVLMERRTKRADGQVCSLRAEGVLSHSSRKQG